MKGGINFEEWKEIVKKNRRSLRSKSNIFRFEPESLTYGAEKAVKSPEYGQVHTITYNVTGMDIPSSWPTEIKSGKTLTLDNIIIPYGATNTVRANLDYAFANNTLTVENVLNNLEITVEIGDIVYENAKLGDYLYSDWTFGPTAQTGWLGRCVGTADMFNDGKTRWCSPASSSSLKWSTEKVDTSLVNHSSESAKTDFAGEANTKVLVALGKDKYPAAAWASEQFNGLGYLPAAGELWKTYLRKEDGYDSYKHLLALYRLLSGSGPMSSTERNSTSFFGGDTVTGGDNNKTVTWIKTCAFCKLSGPCGKPINNNGHEYVDLGLPSGTLWATMNVGASSETEYGNYYMYGMGSKTYDSTDTPYAGTEDPLDLTKDTARVVWGGDWHMPTRAQMQELIANTTYQWVTNYKGSGINGETFTATNGVVLFLPAAGNWTNGSLYNVGGVCCYYGSSLNNSDYAYVLRFYGGGEGVYSDTRDDGYSVRGVIG